MSWIGTHSMIVTCRSAMSRYLYHVRTLIRKVFSCLQSDDSGYGNLLVLIGGMPSDHYLMQCCVWTESACLTPFLEVTGF